jgi:hypothetical protein
MGGCHWQLPALQACVSHIHGRDPPGLPSSVTHAAQAQQEVNQLAEQLGCSQQQCQALQEQWDADRAAAAQGASEQAARLKSAYEDKVRVLLCCIPAGLTAGMA